jgi:hypothetical protein
VTEVLGATLLLDLGDEEEVSGSADSLLPSSIPTTGGGDPPGADGPGGRLHTRALYLLAPDSAADK